MGKVMSRESMERYSKGVGSCGKMAEAEMRASLKEYIREHPDAGVEDLRNFCIRRIGEIGGFYGGAAQQLAETMLAEVSELNGYAAPRLDGYVYAPEMERLDGDVRYLMEKWKDGDEQGFIDAVCATARANAEFGANATMAHAAAKQAERNGKKGGKRKEARGGGRKQASALRFARVPMGGRETCDFCIMLASRGFVYHTKETAGELKHYHVNCACRIVPGFEGDRVDGYDPDYFYDVWKHPEDHPEVRDARNARRRELYREKHPESGRKSVGAQYSNAYRDRDNTVASINFDTIKFKQNQFAHFEGSPQFYSAHEGRGAWPSCFTIGIDEVRKLIREHAGHGTPCVSDNGEWTRKEVCVADHPIGFVFSKNGDKIPTRVFKIHYANGKIHAVPKYDKGEKPDELG